jgi:hypothetical protein
VLLEFDRTKNFIEEMKEKLAMLATVKIMGTTRSANKTA